MFLICSHEIVPAVNKDPVCKRGIRYDIFFDSMEAAVWDKFWFAILMIA
jgi:hypothetical protein